MKNIVIRFGEKRGRSQLVSHYGCWTRRCFQFVKSHQPIYVFPTCFPTPFFLPLGAVLEWAVMGRPVQKGLSACTLYGCTVALGFLPCPPRRSSVLLVTHLSGLHELVPLPILSPLDLTFSLVSFCYVLTCAINQAWIPSLESLSFEIGTSASKLCRQDSFQGSLSLCSASRSSPTSSQALDF